MDLIQLAQDYKVELSFGFQKSMGNFLTSRGNISVLKTALYGGS